MGYFDEAYKNEPTYLDIATNGNGDEKALLTLEALRRCNRNDAHIVEIGPGGGAAIDALVEGLDTERGYQLDLSLVEIEDITSDQLTTSRNRFEATLGKTALFTADARELSRMFEAESMDIVASSAVLHEIYSYGNGYRGLHEVMSSITSVLKPGGYFAYRDIFAVQNMSLHERTTQAYNAQGWLRFISAFVPHYLEHAIHPYHHNEDELLLRQDSKKVNPDNINPSNDLIAEGPIGLFREIQRHYITFRDHLWRSGTLGFQPVLAGELANDWLDIKGGHKRIHFHFTDSNFLSQSQKKLLVAMSESINNHYVIDGDIFDGVTDTAINDFFVLLNSGDHNLEELWNKWLQREGAETYAYMTIDQLLGTVALKSLESDCKQQSILLPVKNDDVIVTPRAYYNRLLKMLPNPLFDGKQLVLFQKMQLSDTSAVEAGLSAIQAHCSKATLSALYSHVSRKV